MRHQTSVKVLESKEYTCKDEQFKVLLDGIYGFHEYRRPKL